MEEREPSKASLSCGDGCPGGDEAPVDGAPEPAPAQDLGAELERQRQVAEELGSRLVRLQADFDNYRKRVTREQARWHEDARCDLVVDLLPVIDNLELALGQEGDAGSIRQGLELIHRQLIDVLAGYGVKKIQAAGGPFDPTFHDAVMQVETDEHDDGAVAQELRTGYLMGDRLLRPSAVKVAVGPSQDKDREADER